MDFLCVSAPLRFNLTFASGLMYLAFKKDIAMPKSISFEAPEINLTASMEVSKSLPESDTPFRIALLGDWSGQTKRNLPTNESQPSDLRPIPVDRDNFDEVMRKLGVEVHLKLNDAASSPITLQFNELDDFLPDRIYERLGLFEMLKQTRRRLRNPSTFAEAADEVRAWSKIKTDDKPRESTSTQKQAASISGLSTLDGSDLLNQILGEVEDQSQTAPQVASSSSEVPDDLHSMLQSIVQPHLVPSEDSQQAELIAAVDEATSGLMRFILHHPNFQAVESAWRALYFLVSRLETGTALKLYLLNISKAELAANLLTAEGESKSRLDKIFVEQASETLGGELWAALAGNYTFDQTLEDIELLNCLSHLAGKAGAPFLGAASPHILGCESLASTPDPDDWQLSNSTEEKQAWAAFRQRPEASFIGLALPRFLLRLPYGKDTEPIEQFDFEEFTGEPKHEDYLWGNPAFACVYLMAQAFSADGWEMRPGTLQDIEGLPLHIYEVDGESQVKPCAETLLTLRAAEIILKRGLMPLLSFKGTDAIRLAMFQSLAEPVTALSGHWH
jgi:type VI secretion system protein ImpC